MLDTQHGYGGRARRALTAITTLAALAALGLSSACGPGSTAAKAPTGKPTAPLSLAITPAAGTANAPISTEVGIALAGGKITEVSLTKAGSADKIPGAMRADG